MIELLPKITGMLKSSAFPLFLMTMFHSNTKQIIQREKTIHDEDVPGDNFPYIVMTSHDRFRL